MGRKRRSIGGKPSGNYVRLLEYAPNKIAEVDDLLSIQFTCYYMDGTNTLSFRHYADKGVTWDDYEDEYAQDAAAAGGDDL